MKAKKIFHTFKKQNKIYLKGIHFIKYFINLSPNGWIGRRATEWPPRPPDLSPFDFFLFDHLKLVVYKTQSETLKELRKRITKVGA